jgi:hypothetical protein
MDSSHLGVRLIHAHPGLTAITLRTMQCGLDASKSLGPRLTTLNCESFMKKRTCKEPFRRCLVAYSSDDVFLTQLIRVGEGMNILGLMIGFPVLALLSVSLFAFFLAKQSD